MTRQNRGALNGNAKLTESRVEGIHAALALGWLHRDIAELFEVSRPTVTLISNGKTWRHVTPPAARDLIAAVVESLAGAA